MRFLKNMSALFLMLIFCSTAVFAQGQPDPVSDAELEKFVGVFAEVQVLNQKGQEKMVTVIEEEGLDVQRFNEMQQAQMSNNQEVEASAEEKESYEKVTKELGEIQGELQQEMMTKIEGS